MSSGIRYLVSVAVAVMVTLSAFFLMHKLISNEVGEPQISEPPPGIRFGPVELETVFDRKPPVRPEEPEPPETPPPPPDFVYAKIEPVQQAINIDLPLLDGLDGMTTFSLTHGQGRAQEGDIVPLVMVQPQYPREAAIREIEGYVTVQFTITETGSVRSPKVIDSSPPRIFDNEATRAILGWKFKPRVVNGVAVPRVATQTLEFTLEGT